MEMDAVLATIVHGGQAIIVIDIEVEVVEINKITHLIYNLMLNPLKATSPNPFCKGSQGWGGFRRKNHATGEANGSIMVGMFMCLCFASQKPSEREFFVLTQMDLAVKLLN
jgi:hypothetical protein